MCCFPLHPGAKQQHNALTLLLHLSVADRKQWAVYILWWTGLPRIIYTLQGLVDCFGGSNSSSARGVVVYMMNPVKYF